MCCSAFLDAVSPRFRRAAAVTHQSGQEFLHGPVRIAIERPLRLQELPRFVHITFQHGADGESQSRGRGDRFRPPVPGLKERFVRGLRLAAVEPRPADPPQPEIGKLRIRTAVDRLEKARLGHRPISVRELDQAEVERRVDGFGGMRIDLQELLKFVGGFARTTRCKLQVGGDETRRAGAWMLRGGVQAPT